MGKVINYIKRSERFKVLPAILLAALFCLPGFADAAITRVQSSTGDTGAAAATSIAVTLGSAPVTGNTLIAVISTRGTSASRVTSITQTGATWTKVSEGTNTNGSTTEIWYAPNVSGAGTGVTINQASLFSAAVIIEYSGLLTPTSLDKSVTSSAATAASTTATTGTTTTTAQASELFVGGIGLVNSGYTLGTPTNSFAVVATDKTTSATASSNSVVYALEKMVSATGTANTGGTISTSSFSSGTIATFKEDAPDAGVVTVTPQANGYISSAPTITTAFSSSWALSGCEYTVNGGTNWAAGTVSGSAPSFSCSASVTGLSGTVNINMRATSSFTGTGSGTAVSRTVDTTNPTDGVLSLYPGNPDIGLLWTAASDGAGSGFDHYDVYFQTGAAAPACGSGTLLYTGKWRNYTHSGLPANTQYSYRVCATDKVGNVSSGAFGTVTTTARASAVNSCTACHGYPPVDNAARVGGTVGQFPGSHNKHSGTGAGQMGFDCTKCHVSVSTFSHSRGTVDMANPLNGDAGASYSKGTSPAVGGTPGYCSNTYCHSNGTSVATGTVAANTTPNWGSGALTCSSCHQSPPQYTSGSPKMNNHTTARGHKFVIGTTTPQTCDTCHNSVTYSGGVYTTNAAHNDGAYSLNTSLGYTFVVGGSTCATPGNGCHGPTAGTWGGHLGCIDCHNKQILRTKGRPGAYLANAVAEFGQAWGHKRSGRGAVTDDDCCVCHLEGDGVKHKASAYHQDGNIDLRDPDGTGEAPITNISGSAFAFQRFSTSYAATSRTSTGHTANTIDNVITQKFCLACHDSNGATNTTARSGVSPTQYLPFGTGSQNPAATYPVPISAGVAGGVFDAKSQFATTNSSFHPVMGPKTKDFPTPARLYAPYNNFARAGTSGTKTEGVVINCMDCHNIVGTAPLTLRTVVAHGNAVTIRGGIRASGTNMTANLCINCHQAPTTSTGYLTSGFHGTGSAFLTGNSNMSSSTMANCYYCHGTATAGATVNGALQVRPIRAVEVHGFNDRTQGTVGSKWTNSTFSHRPYAFIRNSLSYWSPKSVSTAGESVQRAAGCTGTGGTCDNNMGSTTSYTTGGTY